MAEQKIKLIIDTEGRAGGISVVVNGLNKVKGAADNVGSRLDFMGRAFTRMLAPLQGMLTVGALARFAQKTIENADALGKQAQSAGENVKQFSALAEVAKLAGTSAEQMVTASKGLAEWLDKTGQSGKAFTAALIEQAEVFAAMPDGLEKVRMATERFGKSGQAMIPFLNQGSEAIREQIEELEKFGVVIGPRFAANAAQFNDNVTRQTNIIRGMGNLIADTLLPTFISWQERFIQWIKDSQLNLIVVDVLIARFQRWALSVATLAGGLQIAASFAGTFVQTLAASLSPTQAWAAAIDKSAERVQKLKEKVQEILKLRRTPDEGGETAVDRLAQFQSARAESEMKTAELQAKLQTVQLSGTVFENSGAIRGTVEQMQELLTNREMALQQAKQEKLIDNAEARAMELADTREQIRLRQQLVQLKEQTNDFTFTEKLKRNFQVFADEVTNIGATIADVMMNGVRRSIDAVANGIWAVIDGTATWGQIFIQVGRQIISDLIRIALQETIVFGIKKTLASAWKSFMTLMRGKDVLEHNATEAAKAPALAANATLASIASWGTAVVVGIAAIAGIIASMGAFESGGVVRGGQQIIRVNEGGTEAVLNAQATARLGEAGVNALNAGDFDLASRMANSLRMDSPSVASTSGRFASAGEAGGQIKIAIVLVDDVRSAAASDLIMSSAGRAAVIHVVKDSRMEIGIPTS